jgi:hypothetical protein
MQFSRRIDVFCLCDRIPETRGCESSGCSFPSSVVWILVSLGLLLITIDAYAQRRGGFSGHPPAINNPGGVGLQFRAPSSAPAPQSAAPYVMPYAVYGGGDPQPESPQIPEGAVVIPYPYPPQRPPEQTSPPVQPCPAAAPEPPPINPVRFFIALKDHWVYVAIAYWVQSGTLHYVTPRGSHNQVSLDLVDRKISKKLNAPGSDFALPD